MDGCGLFSRDSHPLIITQKCETVTRHCHRSRPFGSDEVRAKATGIFRRKKKGRGIVHMDHVILFFCCDFSQLGNFRCRLSVGGGGVLLPEKWP